MLDLAVLDALFVCVVAAAALLPWASLLVLLLLLRCAAVLRAPLALPAPLPHANPRDLKADVAKATQQRNFKSG